MSIQTEVHYQICAKMAEVNGVPADTTLWLGPSYENRPHWTTRDQAFRFHTFESAKTFFESGKGYTSFPIYKPIMKTVLIVEQTITTTITDICHALG